MMTREAAEERAKAEARLYTLVEEPDWCWGCSDAILPGQPARTTFVEIADVESGPSPYDIWEVRIHTACGTTEAVA